MRIVLKIGSALISRGPRIDYRWMRRKVREIAALHRGGHDIVIVSSGAVAAGMEIEGVVRRPVETLRLQLLAGVGQIKLMKYYKDYFKRERLVVAQVLLTHHNFSTGAERAAVETIMNAFLSEGTIPVVNENDLVNKEELEYRRTFTDNDILAALVAVCLNVDLAILLTDVDGLYRGDPKQDAGAVLIERIPRIDGSIRRLASRETNALGLGGMSSKIRAAELMTRRGIDVIVAGGRRKLSDVIENRVKRSLFLRQTPPAGAVRT